MHEWKKWNVDQKGSNRPAAYFGVRYHYNILVFVLLFVCVCVPKTTYSRHSMLFDGKFGDMGNFYWSREHLCVCSLYFPEKVIWGNFSFDNVYVWNTRWCCYSAGAIKRFTILTKFCIHGMRKLVSIFYMVHSIIGFLYEIGKCRGQWLLYRELTLLCQFTLTIQFQMFKLTF